MNDAQILNLIYKYNNIYEMCCRKCKPKDVDSVFREVCFDIRMNEDL